MAHSERTQEMLVGGLEWLNIVSCQSILLLEIRDLTVGTIHATLNLEDIANGATSQYLATIVLDLTVHINYF